MKIFKGKAFFFKSAFIYLFLITAIYIVSVLFWENSFYNIIMNNLTKRVDNNSQVVLVMIDNKSTDTYRWPWARKLYGEILNYFSEYTNAKVVAFDSIVTKLDKYNPKDSDMYFFDAVKKSKNYIGGFLAFDREYSSMSDGNAYDKKFYNKFHINIDDKRNPDSITTNTYNSLSSMPEQYFNSMKYIGSANLTKNYNGFVYTSPDLVSYKGAYYPSLPLSIYLLANNTNKITITGKYILVDKTGLKIPVLYYGGDLSHYIKFYKRKPNSEYTHTVYSAIDIINSYRLLKEGKKPIINPEIFQDKLIIIGGNSINAEDTQKTLLSSQQPGADIHACALSNLINNDFVFMSNDFQNYLTIFIMCVITFLAIRFLPLIPSLWTMFLFMCGYFALCVFSFAQGFVPLVITPIAVQIATMIFGYAYRFILEGRNKEKIKNVMGRYLSQDIMKNVVQNIDDVKLGGKKATVTVLFSDIRGFTSMSEKMTAEEVSVILNEYFSEMEPIITKYNGVINKFIGDAVMAIFGEPIQDVNHPQNAVKCAYEMLKRVEFLRDKWMSEGKPKIEIGIGINTGEAFVGNIGSEKRLEYTVIGDTVNLASRIEGYNKVYKTNLLISHSTYTSVSDIVDVIKIADVTIRGKSKKMDIYEVLKVQK